MRTLSRIAALFLALATSLASSVSAKSLPPEDPILRIDPGMHTGVIKRIGVDAACTRMVTGSDDKTARIWDISDRSSKKPKLLRTLRPPLGPGNDGKIYAVAMSPDGKWVAAGGWDVYGAKESDNGLYIFEATTGRLVKRIARLGTVALHLTFSPDGLRLAATLAGGQGLRVWRTSEWTEISRDTDYGGQSSYGATFDAKGRLWTVAYGGKLRRYTPRNGKAGFELPPSGIETSGGARPFSVAVNPVTGHVAIGFRDSTNVEVYDGETMHRGFAADTASVDDGEISSVAWSRNGVELSATGEYRVRGRVVIRTWSKAGHGPPRDLPGPLDTVMQLLPCGDAIGFGASDPAFGLIRPDGTRLIWQDSVKPDMRSGHFEVSKTGDRVRFGLEVSSAKAVQFDLVNQNLSDAPKPPSDLFLADTGPLNVGGWINTPNPTLNGKPIKLRQYEWSRSLAIAPGGDRFVLGTEWRLRAYEKSGKLLWIKQVPGVAWGVNIPKDGRIVVAAYGDGTIRWHRLSDGQELLALFVHAKDKRWVLWTPTGYYTTSPGGEDLIGWHVNQGWDREAAFFPVKLFRKQFYRPDIVRLLLETLDEEKAVEKANAVANLPRAPKSVAKILPPVIEILNHADGATFNGRTITLAYSATSLTGEKIRDVEVRVDGQPIAVRGLVPVNAADNKLALTIDVPLPPRDVTVSLIAWSGDGVVRRASKPASVLLKWTGKTPDTSKLPRLFGLFVGVSKYKQAKLNLTYADADARALSAALEGQKGRAYRSVETRVLTNADATRGNILRGLKWLREVAETDDVIAISFSGHGVTDPTNDFHFMPHEATAEEPTIDGLAKDVLISRISRIRGRRIVFMDACHAGDGLAMPASGLGPADMTGLVNEFNAPQVGVIMYAASTGRQLSVEGKAWGHGVFTKALLEGLAGKADLTDGNPPGIHTGELDVWLTRRVQELTGNAQTPTMVKSTVPHFTIAMN